MYRDIDVDRLVDVYGTSAAGGGGGDARLYIYLCTYIDVFIYVRVCSYV